MPLAVQIFIPIFVFIFIGIFVFAIISTAKSVKNNNTAIKQFSVYGKKYLLYSMVSYNRYTNAVIYQLKDDKGVLLGSFNSLDDVLTFLNIKEFPNDDRYRY